MSGVIYELRCCINNEWHPFYVGRTNNPKTRMSGHRSGAKTGNTLVYQFIREQLVPADIAWDMFTVETYEEYDEQEDEHIMGLLYDGIQLKNMKKGDARWMERRLAEAQDMQRRGVRSYRTYRQQLTLEEQQRIADERHAKWLFEQQEKQKQTRMQQVLAEVQAKRADEIAEKRKKEEARRLRAIKQQQEVEQARAIQRAEWEQANTVWLAEQAKQKAIADAFIEQKRIAQQTELKLQREQELEQLDNNVNAIVTKIGLTPIVRNKNTKGFGNLFEEEE
jgi:hypothetical protein